jgi:hypothetical protein
VLAPGSPGLAAAARAHAVLARRPEDGALGAQQVAALLAAVAAATAGRGGGGGSSSPPFDLLAPPGAFPWLTDPSSRTTAWRHPEARARLGLLKPVLRAAVAAAPGEPATLFSRLAAASPEGVPVDAVSGQGGVCVFVGLPSDASGGGGGGGGRAGRAGARARVAIKAAAAAASASSSAPPLRTAVVLATALARDSVAALAAAGVEGGGGGGGGTEWVGEEEGK